MDWVEFDGRWHRPNSSSLAYYYAQEHEGDGIRVGQGRINEVLAPIQQAASEGLFTPKGLAILHPIMSDIYASMDTSEEEIAFVCDYIREVLNANGVAISAETAQSNFMQYPLYAAIVTPDSVKGYWER